LGAFISFLPKVFPLALVFQRLLALVVLLFVYVVQLGFDALETFLGFSCLLF
jgi:hypothetical protein